jgi:hypothetical protein
MSVEGFFKDFSIDMAVPPLSYCTLTIEGLAENEALPDDGGDPAPDGRSTMQLLAPIAITDAGLVASSVSETDYAAWSNSTDYGKSARVILAATHRIYESAVDGNAGNDPAGSSGKWLDVGPTNRWAMFDQALGSATSAPGSIVVTITAAAIGAIALLDVVGAAVRVETGGYDQTLPVGAGAITFLDLPPATTGATVTITGADIVSVGTLLAGKVVGLGITEASPTAGITDYSRKVVNDFGEVTVVPRAWAKKMDGKTLISTSAIDAVFGRLAAVRATPALWIGDEGLDCLTIYGFVRDFSLQVGETLSNLSLSIEGLSTAGKVAPLVADGVDWTNVGDTTGKKPDDNATNSADPDSPFGPGGTVGGTVKQLSDFDAAIAAARKYQDALDSDTIPAINKAVADAGERITAARKAADDALDGLTEEAARAARAEGHLSDRIDSLVAEGGYDDTDVRAAITRVEEAYVKADAGIARRIDDVQTSLDGVGGAIDAKAREVTTAYTQADKALSDRALTLEASARSIDDALNGPGGVQARLTSYGSTLADLPGRYAAASDVATLLSQVNFATDSGLLRTVNSRIEERASAIADAKVGAVAETYRGITADLNGRVGRVEERTGAIAGIDGRTTVYWEVLGSTPDGKTRVRLSKSDGTKGVFYVDADMVVDGNLLVAGSVTTKTIAANNITQPVAQQTTTVKQISWQDANPNYGVEVTIANPIGAPVRLDFRYSQQGGGQGGQPPFTVQIQRVSPDGSTVNFSDASYIGGIILDPSPPVGPWVTYRFYFKHAYPSGQGTTNVIYQQLFALELRR